MGVRVFWKKSLNAQGTLEYLVIIAVVVVLALVVVGLLVNQTGSVGSVSDSVSKIGSSSGVISVSEAVVDSGGDGLVRLGNSSGGALIVTKLIVEGVSLNYSDVSLVHGESKIFSLSDLGSSCSCVGFAGKTRMCDVIVFTQSEYGLEKQFTTSVSVDCVFNTLAVDERVVVDPVPPTIVSFASRDNNSEPLIATITSTDSAQAIQWCWIDAHDGNTCTPMHQKKGNPIESVNAEKASDGNWYICHGAIQTCTDYNASRCGPPARVDCEGPYKISNAPAYSGSSSGDYRFWDDSQSSGGIVVYRVNSIMPWGKDGDVNENYFAANSGEQFNWKGIRQTHIVVQSGFGMRGTTKGAVQYCYDLTLDGHSDWFVLYETSTELINFLKVEPTFWANPAQEWRAWSSRAYWCSTCATSFAWEPSFEWCRPCQRVDRGRSGGTYMSYAFCVRLY